MSQLILLGGCGWLLKEPFLCCQTNKMFTWSWCTLWQPWCPHWRHAWPAHQAAEDAQLSGSLCLWWWNACCSGPDGLIQKQFSQRCHWQSCSWCSWLCCWYQCQGAPASTPCRCRWSSSPSSSCGASCPQYEQTWPLRRPSLLPWMLS